MTVYDIIHVVFVGVGVDTIPRMTKESRRLLWLLGRIDTSATLPTRRDRTKHIVHTPPPLFLLANPFPFGTVRTKDRIRYCWFVRRLRW